jgi:hypothetical protein
MKDLSAPANPLEMLAYILSGRSMTIRLSI